MNKLGLLVAVSLLVPARAPAQRGPASGLATQFSKSGDTIVARVNGAVPANAVRRLAETLRIQPTENDTGLFNEVYQFKVDKQGRVWAFDDEAMTIFLFGADGKLVRKIGRRGAGPGEFQHNGGMAMLRDGRVAHVDFRNARVSFFSPGGDYLTSWPVPSTSFFGLDALVVDTTDVVRLRWNGLFRDNLQSQLLLRLKDGGGAFVGDTAVFPRTPIQTRDLIVGTGPRAIGLGIPFQPYFSVKWQWAGGFVTANGETGAVTIAQPNGGVVRVERTAPPVLVTPEERAEAEAGISFSARRIDPTWSWTGAPLASSKPRTVGVFAARDGRVWVQVAGEAQLIPEEGRSPQRENRPPPNKWRSATVWEVYAPNGIFLGRVPFAKNGLLMHAEGDTVWVIEGIGSGDFRGLVRYRIEPSLSRN